MLQFPFCKVDLEEADLETQDSVTLPLSLGGLGLRSALRTSKAAYWASWADCLGMISERHPEVAQLMVDELEGALERLAWKQAASAARELTGVCDFDPPTWHALAQGVRPASRKPEDFEPGCCRDGWQHEAASRVESHFRDSDVFTRVDAARMAMVRSQGGPGAGLALSTCPTSRLTKIPPQLFRVVLLRRLGLPLPLTARSCRCGRPLDSCGHHRAACARAGVLAGRGWALESAVARVCREAGGRVTTNVMIRDLDLIQPGVVDARRELIGLTGLWEARRRKERTYLELMGHNRRARLVVLGIEVGGRWSQETQQFVSQLA